MGGADVYGSRPLGGRYRLVEQLGAGGMSVVWRGYDEVLGRQVAVKVLAARLAADRALRHRLRVEAQAAARLCHPNIANVYDYGESRHDDEPVPYVVMELVDGESLAARLGRVDALPWADAVLAGAEVASALATAHARGVVHRDVTPANVMLTAAGAKVVDFGISALVGERDAGPDGSLLGTPAYLAPERLEGGEVSPATDVYALGLLLYRTLTGRLPWEVATTTQMLRAHLHRDPAPMPPVEGLPDEVAELCARCLAKDPAARPDSAEVARTLAAAVGVSAVVPLSPAPVGGDPAGPAVAATTILPGSTVTDALPVTTAGSPGRGRRRRVAAVAGAAGLLAVAGLAWSVTADPSASADKTRGTVGLTMREPVACAVDYRLREDTGSGFEANLVVTNAGSEPVRAWKLTFTFPGDQTVTGAGSAAWEQHGREVTIGPAPGGGLAAGESASLDLSGRYAGANPLPVHFQVDGTACDVQVSAEVVGGGAAGGRVASVPAAERPETRGGGGRPGDAGKHGSSKGKGPGKGKGRD